MTPEQVATALTHHIYGNETSDERECVLRKKEEGARVRSLRVNRFWNSRYGNSREAPVLFLFGGEQDVRLSLSQLP